MEEKENMMRKKKEKKKLGKPLKSSEFFIYHIYQPPSARGGYDTRSILEPGFNRFKFRVFLLLD